MTIHVDIYVSSIVNIFGLEILHGFESRLECTHLNYRLELPRCEAIGTP